MTPRQIEEMAKRDVRGYLRDGNKERPNFGWDDWLTGKMTDEAACHLLGEDPKDNEFFWSESMMEKLQIYDKAAELEFRVLSRDFAGEDADHQLKVESGG